MRPRASASASRRWPNHAKPTTARINGAEGGGRKGAMRADARAGARKTAIARSPLNWSEGKGLDAGGGWALAGCGFAHGPSCHYSQNLRPRPATPLRGKFSHACTLHPTPPEPTPQGKDNALEPPHTACEANRNERCETSGHRIPHASPGRTERREDARRSEYSKSVSPTMRAHMSKGGCTKTPSAILSMYSRKQKSSMGGTSEWTADVDSTWRQRRAM